MKIILIVIFILVLLFLQMGIFSHLKIAGSFPNLILLSILSLGILQGWKKTLPWCIAGGLFLDFYSFSGILGISVIGLLVVNYLADFLSQGVIKKANLQSLFLIFLITIFVYSLIVLIFSDFRFLAFMAGIIYNLIFSLPIFYTIKWLEKSTK